MAYLSKLCALEGEGGDYKLDKSNLIAPHQVHRNIAQCDTHASK
jgi:hypothetical protein